MNKRFAIGDIHGSYKALLQCIDKSGIDKDLDTLIVLGDVADGWAYVKECVDELLTFKNLIIIRGNHDQWFMDYAKTGIHNQSWLKQGGEATLKSYKYRKDFIDEHVDKYFNKSLIYYCDSKNNLFVHGGINWTLSIDKQSLDDLMWDRHMYQTALQWESYNLIQPDKSKMYFKNYNKIFIGHTSTEANMGWKYNAGTIPVFASNVVNLDTGAGWSGKLTIMDIDTYEWWQSDIVKELYPGEFGR